MRAPAVLWAPDCHIQELEKIWLDGQMNIVPWKHHVLKLQKEWKELILYATVLRECAPTPCSGCTYNLVDLRQYLRTRPFSPCLMLTTPAVTGRTFTGMPFKS
jgi:hypothetical protein